MARSVCLIILSHLLFMHKSGMQVSGNLKVIMALCRRLQVSAGPRVAPKEEWWNKNCPDNMREISSVQQFVDELVG